MNNQNSEIAFYITAGGKARRMNGCVKAFVEVGGKRIIDANLEQVPKEISKVGIISNEPKIFAEYILRNISIISDIYKEIGPLAGLHAAIFHCNTSAVIISASDMPNIKKEIINKLISTFRENDFEAVVPSINGKIEPLFAIYSISILEKLEAFINKGESYAVRRFLKKINVQYLEFSEEESFHNINSEADL